MDADRLLADVQAFADLPVRPAGHDLRQHASFPDAQAERLRGLPLRRGRGGVRAAQAQVRRDGPRRLFLAIRLRGGQDLERRVRQRDPGPDREVGDRPQQRQRRQARRDGRGLHQGLARFVPMLAAFTIRLAGRQDGRRLASACPGNVVGAADRGPPLGDRRPGGRVIVPVHPQQVRPRGGELRVHLPAREDVRPNPGTVDDPLDLGQDGLRAGPDRGERTQVASVSRRLRDLGGHPEQRAGGGRREHPVFGRPHAIPGHVGHPTSVGRVAPPEGEGRRRLVGGHSELRVGDQLQLHEQAAQHAAGILARGELRLHGDEPHRGMHERDAGRRPFERVHRQGPRLAPPPEHEQRVHRPAPQAVAVDGLQAGRLCRGDPRLRDVDRVLAPALDVQDGGEVRARPECILQPLEPHSDREGVLQSRDRGLRATEPTVDDAKGAGRVTQPGVTGRTTCAGQGERLRREAFGLDE